MALFNYATKEITLKIVYYGPGLSGKTTNLQYLHSVLNPENKGRLLSLSTEADRTLFFDFLPIELGKIRDFSIRFQLYTVPGQVRYNATRKVVLKGADAVVFVADSQRDMREQNIESFENMRENLSANNINPDEVPVVLQYNKRDLMSALSVADLNSDLNHDQYHVVEASAISGAGVEDSFRLITRLLLKHIAKKHQIEIQPQKEKEVAAPLPSQPEKEEIAATPLPRPFSPAAVPAYGTQKTQGLSPKDEIIEEKEPASPAPAEEEETAVEEAGAPSSGTSFTPAAPQTYEAGKTQDLRLTAEPAEEGETEEKIPSGESRDFGKAWPTGSLHKAEMLVEEIPATVEKETAPAAEEVPPVAALAEEETVAGAEVTSLPPIPSEKTDRLIEEMATIAGLLADLRNSVYDLGRDMKDVKATRKGREDSLIAELPNIAGLLTDLKNSVYVLSKDMKEIRKGQEETNLVLREISALLERGQTKKRWFRS